MTSFTCRASRASVTLMPKPKALKVFRTPIGFHDAYVAAPTKKAALEAWGSHRNLFALGEAEQVTDPKLMRAALATPGVVVKVSRGSTAEQLKALPPNEKPRAKMPEPKHEGSAKKPVAKKAIPQPSRAKLERAEASLAEVAAANTDELAVLEAEIDSLRKRRDALQGRLSQRMAAAQAVLDRAQSDYDSQLERWRSDP
jgi:hypothetical protein